MTSLTSLHTRGSKIYFLEVHKFVHPLNKLTFTFIHVSFCTLKPKNHQIQMGYRSINWANIHQFRNFKQKHTIFCFVFLFFWLVGWLFVLCYFCFTMSYMHAFNMSSFGKVIATHAQQILVLLFLTKFSFIYKVTMVTVTHMPLNMFSYYNSGQLGPAVCTFSIPNFCTNW